MEYWGLAAHRRPEIPYSDAPQGRCRWCGETIVHTRGEKRGQPNLRRRWHPDCVDEYNRSDPREARRHVRRRDRGICASCGIDTYALKRRIKGRGSHRKLRELGFKPRKSLWELDHRVPLIDGGGHELENLQTLCTPCHKRKTAEEAGLRGERRRSEALEQAEQELLQRVDAALAESKRLLASLGDPDVRDGSR